MGPKRNREPDVDPGELHWEIVRTVAETKNVDPLELDEQLYDVVDPDALWRVFADRADGTPRGDGHVTFRLARCEVTVDSQWGVSVSPLDGSVAD
jgi:hypothetical protein